MARYIIILFSCLLSLCLAVTLVQIVIQKGAREACKVLAGILFAIVTVITLTPPITWGLTELTERLSLSDKDITIFGSIGCTILLFIASIALFYKKAQPRVAISGAYLINLSVWVFIFAHIGLIDKTVSEATVFFILANGVLVWSVVGLNQPPADYHKSWFYWPLILWSMATILVCLMFFYWHNSGIVTGKSIVANQTANRLESKRQEKMQEIISNEIKKLENSYNDLIGVATTIEDCTKADPILSDIHQKKAELEEIKRNPAMLKPVANAIYSATQMASSVKKMVNEEGFVSGSLKRLWRAAFGKPSSSTRSLSLSSPPKPQVIQLNWGDSVFVLGDGGTTPWLKSASGDTYFSSCEKKNFKVEFSNGEVLDKDCANDPNLYMPYAMRVIADGTQTVVVTRK